MKKLILTFFIALTMFSCKKKDQSPTYEVTYAFTSTSESYYVQIWDVTEQNDFSDSVHTPTFYKTIIYDYAGTHRCKISNANNKVSVKAIAIRYNGTTNTQSDSLYSTIESFIHN